MSFARLENYIPRSSVSASLRLCALAFIALASVAAKESKADEPHRSPVDLVIEPGGAWLATVNQTSNSVSLIRLPDGQLLDEIASGSHPIAIALAPDGRTLLVSNHYSGEITLLAVRGAGDASGSGAGLRLEKLGEIEVGFQPHDVAVAPDGKTAYVACTATAAVAVLDLDKRQVTARIDVGRWPRHLALSPDGTRLAVGTSGDRGVTIVATTERKALYQEQFVGLNIGHMQCSRDGRFVWFPWMVYRNNPITTNNIRLGWVLASRIARVRLDSPARREAMSLDPQGRAIADVHGLAMTSDESRLVVSAAGTHELLVYRTAGLPLKDYGGSDHVDPELLNDSERFFRIELGGRPLGLRIGRDDRTVYVANYLLDAVQVVDVASRAVTRTIPLGGPKEISLARRGEAIFYDARRSFDQWYSCHTCHYEGGTNSVTTDNMDDGTAFTFKTVLPLDHLAETGPWTWHGWQPEVQAMMKKSLTEAMLGPLPTDEDIAAVLAYLHARQPPPNPFRGKDGSLSAAAERGRRVFESKAAACANCHRGEYFTDGKIHDLGLGSPRDKYKGFNTPSLRGVYARVKLLHDGRVDSLEALLSGPHAPEHVAGTRPLTAEERRDLIEYLKTL